MKRRWCVSSPAGRAERRWPVRLLRLAIGGAVIVVAVAVGVPGLRGPVGQQPAAADSGVTQTRWGPLTAADRELLRRVRTAGLWERPTGLQAQDHAASERVKEVGLHLAEDHAKLDVQVRAVAAQLGVPLPDQPTPQQQGWMAELSSERGATYDWTFVNRLRAAHGTVFGIVAQVRATTQNSVIRSFAQVAVEVVMRHMSLLESTGLFTSQQAATLAAPSIRGPITVPVIVTVAALTLVANLALVRRRSWI
jgi:predicted outer membrane protein